MSPSTSKPIRAAREAAGLTQQQLAQRAGVSLAYLRMIEGGYTPTSSKSPAFARILAEVEGGTRRDA